MKKLISGNQAAFLGAVKAGANFFAGYPITPSSEILIEASQLNAKDRNFKFIQFEDEIASANAVIGASLAGAKAFTATSGPGFCLMQEAIGYAHQVEVPSVFINVMRVGPGTGMPTRPSQHDIMQTKYGGTGDYYSLVFYPNSVEECYRYAVTAFNAAEETLAPVILLTDGFLSHLHTVVDLDEIEVDQIVQRSRPPLGSDKRTFTGLTHDESLTPHTADEKVFRQWHYKVKERHFKVAERYARFEFSGNKKSDTLLIAYGITSRVISPLQSSFAIFRPIRIFPVLSDELKSYSKDFKNIVVVEANDGQYASLVERELRRDVISIPLLGGKISLAEVTQSLKDKLQKEVSNV